MSNYDPTAMYHPNSNRAVNRRSTMDNGAYGYPSSNPNDIYGGTETRRHSFLTSQAYTENGTSYVASSKSSLLAAEQGGPQQPSTKKGRKKRFSIGGGKQKDGGGGGESQESSHPSNTSSKNSGFFNRMRRYSLGGGAPATAPGGSHYSGSQISSEDEGDSPKHPPRRARSGSVSLLQVFFNGSRRHNHDSGYESNGSSQGGGSGLGAAEATRKDLFGTRNSSSSARNNIDNLSESLGNDYNNFEDLHQHQQQQQLLQQPSSLLYGDPNHNSYSSNSINASSVTMSGYDSFSGGGNKYSNNSDRSFLTGDQPSEEFEPLPTPARTYSNQSSSPQKKQQQYSKQSSKQQQYKQQQHPQTIEEEIIHTMSDEKVIRIQQQAEYFEKHGEIEKAIEIWKNILPIKQYGIETMRIRCKIAMLLIQCDTEETDDEASRFLALTDHDIVRGKYEEWLQPVSRTLLHILMDLKSWKLALLVAQQLPGVSNSLLAKIHYETSMMLLEKSHSGKAVDEHLQECHQLLLLEDTKRGPHGIPSKSTLDLWEDVAKAFATRGRYEDSLDCYQSRYVHIQKLFEYRKIHNENASMNGSYNNNMNHNFNESFSSVNTASQQQQHASNNMIEKECELYLDLAELQYSKVENVYIPMGDFYKALDEIEVGLNYLQQFTEENNDIFFEANDGENVHRNNHKLLSLLNDNISERTTGYADIEKKFQKLPCQLIQIKAEVLTKLGHIDDSLNNYEKLIVHMEQRDNITSADVANILYTMGKVCVGVKRYPAAMTYFRRELEMTQTMVGNVHLAVSRILHELARVAEKGLGDYDMAMRYYQEAIQVEHDVMAQSLKSISYCKQCKKAQINHKNDLLKMQQLQHHPHPQHQADASSNNSTRSLLAGVSSQSGGVEGLPKITKQQCCKLHMDMLKDAKAQILETKRCIGRLQFIHGGDFNTALHTLNGAAGAKGKQQQQQSHEKSNDTHEGGGRRLLRRLSAGGLSKPEENSVEPHEGGGRRLLRRLSAGGLSKPEDSVDSPPNHEGGGRRLLRRLSAGGASKSNYNNNHNDAAALGLEQQQQQPENEGGGIGRLFRRRGSAGGVQPTDFEVDYDYSDFDQEELEKRLNDPEPSGARGLIRRLSIGGTSKPANNDSVEQNDQENVGGGRRLLRRLSAGGASKPNYNNNHDAAAPGMEQQQHQQENVGGGRRLLRRLSAGGASKPHHNNIDADPVMEQQQHQQPENEGGGIGRLFRRRGSAGGGVKPADVEIDYDYSDFGQEELEKRLNDPEPGGARGLIRRLSIGGTSKPNSNDSVEHNDQNHVGGGRRLLRRLSAGR